MALTDWTGVDRWKIKPGSLIDFSQILAGDMAHNDLLTITEVSGALDKLIRKLAGTSTSSDWGTTCVEISSGVVVTFTHHGGSAFYLIRTSGTPNTITCWRGRYDPRGEGGPTGAVWTAEDQRPNP